jgi:hypothetical protein
MSEVRQTEVPQRTADPENKDSASGPQAVAKDAGIKFSPIVSFRTGVAAGCDPRTSRGRARGAMRRFDGMEIVSGEKDSVAPASIPSPSLF